MAKPIIELAHRDRFIKVATCDILLKCLLNKFEVNLRSDSRLNWFARGEAPRRGGEANNRARSQGQVSKGSFKLIPVAYIFYTSDIKQLVFNGFCTFRGPGGHFICI